jgi:tetratricopeptide (TPR) repeat protein
MSNKQRSGGISRLFLPAVTIVLTFAPALIAQSTEMPITASKEAVALYVQARDKVDNLEDAGTLYRQAVQIDPNFALAYLNIGDSNREFRENLAKAVALADKVSPGERELIYAAKAQADGDLPGRKMHLENLLKLYPKDKRAHSQMGFYYRSIGDETSALRHFTESTKLDKKFAAAYNMIGYSYLGMGKYPEAESAFKTYISLIPRTPNPYDSYAELLMKMGRYDESIENYKKAIAIDPTFANAYGGVGSNYFYKGDYGKAREAYNMMYEKAPNPGFRDQAIISTISSYIAEGNTDMALKENDRRRQLAEKDGDIQTLIGVNSFAGLIAAEAGRLDDAATYFATADKLRDDPSLPAALAGNRRLGKMMNNARLLIARNDLPAANAQLVEINNYVATSKNPNQERGYNALAGMLALKEKNYSKAIEHFGKADQTDPYVLFHQAAAYEGAGDTKNSSMLVRKVANWNELDSTSSAFVRAKAMAKNAGVAKVPK